MEGFVVLLIVVGVVALLIHAGSQKTGVRVNFSENVQHQRRGTRYIERTQYRVLNTAS